jgi:hypothetical protein
VSTLEATEIEQLEVFLQMKSGYVLNFSNASFARYINQSIGVDIYDAKYDSLGISKAKRLRVFWEVEPDHIVGTLITALIEYKEIHKLPPFPDPNSARCSAIATRLRQSIPALDTLAQLPDIRDSAHLRTLIDRLYSSLANDPTLAIGSAKELVEACCKTILKERDVPFDKNDDIPKLTNKTMDAIQLFPVTNPDHAAGDKLTKKLRGSLGTLSESIGSLRNQYGSGHGHAADHHVLDVRHARLAVGAASTLALFLYETHCEQR